MKVNGVATRDVVPATAHRDAWAEVDLGAIVQNVEAIASLCAPTCRLAPVVKANAYGHGAIEVAAALRRADVGAVCVATLDEALTLRNAGLDLRILVLFDIPARALPDAMDTDVELTVGTAETMDALLALPERDRRRLTLQLKLDTGMSRQGIRFDRLESVREQVTALAGSIRGVWTHLADGADPRSAGDQLRHFDEMVGELWSWGLEAERHTSASSAILAGYGTSYEMARPGLSVYGVLPDEWTDRGLTTSIKVRPAMTVRARAARLDWLPAGAQVGYGGTFVLPERSLIALLPLGYADGIRRGLGNGRSSVLCAGARAPIVGRVSMDSCTVDVTALADRSLDRNSVFTLVGADGPESVTVEELARVVETVPHDILVGLGQRLPRTYRAP